MSDSSTTIPTPQTPQERAEIEPMDPQLRTIQPGGGIVIQLEQAWGSIRRAYLRTFRKGYVRKMESLRKGDTNPCPHPVLDPRDLKYHQNQPGYHWDREDDPFTWRDRIPFARVGLAELLVFSIIFFGLAAGLAWWMLAMPLTTLEQVVGWILVATFAVIGGLIVWFFRDPERKVAQEPGLVVSPADGLVVAIDEIPHDDYIGGPAVMIGIFLSIFNVHINRSPVDAKVVALRYRKGKYLNALRPESARENEQLAVRLEEKDAPHRRMIVRQITGAIARRIVCWLKPGDAIDRGERFGMIKLGSRTELVIPAESGLSIRTKIGEKVKAGSSILAEYSDVSGSE